MEVRFFDEKVKQFIRELELSTSAKVFRTFELLEQFGHRLGMPHSKHLSESLLELRVRGNQEVRLIYAFHNGAAIVLHGFCKKTQRTPRREIEVAHQKLSTLDRI